MGKYEEGKNCLTCNVEGICATCSIACHHEHQFAEKICKFHDPAEYILKGKKMFTECQCFKPNCLLHKSENQEGIQSKTIKTQCAICWFK